MTCPVQGKTCGYGSTEAFWNTFLRPFDLPDHAGSAGRACTDDDVAVVRVYEDHLAEPDDLVARDGHEVGEVAVRSPKCAYSYLNRPREAQARFYKEWLYIGDLATWDEGEYVTIVSRKDDMIISGGENIYPVQVEEALNQTGGGLRGPKGSFSHGSGSGSVLLPASHALPFQTAQVLPLCGESAIYGYR